MGTVLRSLSPVLGELVPMLNICFQKCEISAVFYRDYDQKEVVVRLDYTTDETEIRKFIQANASPLGGGDHPEAQKTAIMELYSNGMLNKRTLVIHYTDAPPHADNDKNTEAKGEMNYFGDKRWDFRWAEIMKLVANTGATFITFCHPGMITGDIYYKHLGKTVACTFSNQGQIMKDTMQTLQQELGIGCEGNPRFKVSTKSLGERLKNPEYLQKVIGILKHQLNERGIKGAIDILCNKVTSEVWRNLLLLRTNEEVIALRNRFSLLANGPTPEQIGRASCRERV